MYIMCQTGPILDSHNDTPPNRPDGTRGIAAPPVAVVLTICRRRMAHKRRRGFRNYSRSHGASQPVEQRDGITWIRGDAQNAHDVLTASTLSSAYRGIS
jgi:hypothetical protein